MVFDGGLKISGGKDKGRRGSWPGIKHLSPHGSCLSRSSGPPFLAELRLSATDEGSDRRLQVPGYLCHDLNLSSDLLTDEIICCLKFATFPKQISSYPKLRKKILAESARLLPNQFTRQRLFHLSVSIFVYLCQPT